MEQNLYIILKGVVGFYVKDEKVLSIAQKPERTLDVATSEDTPGRLDIIEDTDDVVRL